MANAWVYCSGYVCVLDDFLCLLKKIIIPQVSFEHEPCFLSHTHLSNSEGWDGERNWRKHNVESDL